MDAPRVDTKVGKATLAIVRGDVTDQSVEAIVNAANPKLTGGGGVDGAIHRAGGPQIAKECEKWIRENGQLEPGQVAVTSGGELFADWVVHAVGPIWNGGTDGEFVDLERAYENSLRAAFDRGASTVAFPSISTGAYGFPVDRAAYVAVGTIARVLRENSEAGDLEEVRIVLFDDETYDVYVEVLDEVIQTMSG